MTPRERFDSALGLGPIDRVPLFYQHLGAAKWILEATGLRWYDGFHDPETFARLSMAAHELYGFDNVMAGWGDILTEAQAHGMTWKWPERDFYPRVDRYVNVDDVDQIEPIDPMEDRFWSVPLRAAAIMADKIGREVAVVGAINSPTVIASELVGMESLLMSYFVEPVTVHKLLAVLSESSARYGERLREAGVDDVFIENGTAGAEMVSREQYETFDRRYLKQVMGSFKDNGLRTILHNCSAQPFWESQLELAPSALHLHLAAVDAPEVFSAVKGRTCMIAGIDHMRLLLDGTPEEIDENVKWTIEQWGNDPGFMMSGGCELPYKTPRANIRRFKKSVVESGTHQHDVSPDVRPVLG